MARHGTAWALLQACAGLPLHWKCPGCTKCHACPSRCVRVCCSLDEEPTVPATLADLTCDSDGKIDRFINPRVSSSDGALQPAWRLLHRPWPGGHLWWALLVDPAWRAPPHAPPSPPGRACAAGRRPAARAAAAHAAQRREVLPGGLRELGLRGWELMWPAARELAAHACSIRRSAVESGVEGTGRQSPRHGHSSLRPPARPARPQPTSRGPTPASLPPTSPCRPCSSPASTRR